MLATEYDTTETGCQALPGPAGEPAIAGPAAPGGAPLVSTSISHRGTLEVYRQALRIIRPGTGNPDQLPPLRCGTTLQGFSDKSRARLRFLAENSERPLVSQFGLTYHEEWPTDGRTCKQHLDAWLKVVKRTLPGVGYLWLMEFQKRNAPHFHVFLTCPPDLDAWPVLAEAWRRIINGSHDNGWWHGPERGENWMDWDMGSASYLCKYLDKASQKSIPPGYVNFGRFWGNSRDLKPVPRITMETAALDGCTRKELDGNRWGGEKTVIRWLGRLAEKQTRGYSRFRSRAGSCSYSMRRGADAFLQVYRYFGKPPKVKPSRVAQLRQELEFFRPVTPAPVEPVDSPF